MSDNTAYYIIARTRLGDLHLFTYTIANDGTPIPETFSTLVKAGMQPVAWCSSKTGGRLMGVEQINQPTYRASVKPLQSL